MLLGLASLGALLVYVVAASAVSHLMERPLLGRKCADCHGGTRIGERCYHAEDTAILRDLRGLVGALWPGSVALALVILLGARVWSLLRHPVAWGAWLAGIPERREGRQSVLRSQGVEREQRIAQLEQELGLH